MLLLLLSVQNSKLHEHIVAFSPLLLQISDK